MRKKNAFIQSHQYSSTELVMRAHVLSTVSTQWVTEAADVCLPSTGQARLRRKGGWVWWLVDILRVRRDKLLPPAVTH